MDIAKCRIPKGRSDNFKIFLEDYSLTDENGIRAVDKLWHLVKNADKYRGLIFSSREDYDVIGQLSNILYCLDDDMKLWAVHKQIDKYGRYNALNSISSQNMARGARATIWNGILKDYDFVNCHPIISYKLCKDNGYPYEKQEILIKKREKLFKILKKLNSNINRDKAKKLILSCMNGGREDYEEIDKMLVDNGYKMPIEIVEFKREMKIVHELFSKDNKDLYNTTKQKRIKRGDDFNHDGSTYNKVLQNEECKLLFAAIDFINNDRQLNTEYKGVIEFVPIHDGGMIRANINVDCHSVSKYLQKKFGYDSKLKLIHKEFKDVIDLTRENIERFEHIKYKEQFDDIFEEETDIWALESFFKRNIVKVGEDAGTRFYIKSMVKSEILFIPEDKWVKKSWAEILENYSREFCYRNPDYVDESKLDEKGLKLFKKNNTTSRQTYLTTEYITYDSATILNKLKKKPGKRGFKSYKGLIDIPFCTELNNCRFDDKTYLNKFTGFPCENYPLDKVYTDDEVIDYVENSTYYKFLKNDFFAYEGVDAFNRYMNMLRFKMQNPSILLQKIGVYYSEMKGTGKTTNFKFKCNLFGPSRSNVYGNVDILKEKHNKEMKGAMYNCLNEMPKKMNEANKLKNMLKAYSTDDRIQIRGMGSDVGEGKLNYADFDIATKNY